MGRTKTDKPVRVKLLAALFSKGAKKGLSSDFIRDELAPEVLGKRLSEASTKEIFRLVEHLAGKTGEKPYYHRYDSSKAGLIEELEDAAHSRWGADFGRPLNAFINSHRKKAVTHYRFLDVAALKRIKDRIKELNRADGREREYEET